MVREQAIKFFSGLCGRAGGDRALAVKAVFLTAMVLWGHHRGLIHVWPLKIPIAHGINQLLGAAAGLTAGIIILTLTNMLCGW